MSYDECDQVQNEGPVLEIEILWRFKVESAALKIFPFLLTIELMSGS